MFSMSVCNNEVEGKHASQLEYRACHCALQYLSLAMSTPQLACRLVQLSYENLRNAHLTRHRYDLF
jgi:hypothetical protein